MTEKLVWPTTEQVASALHAHVKWIDKEDEYTDARLQVLGPDHGHEGADGAIYLRWAIHVGCSDYDQDHRGYWGAASIRHDDTLASLLSTAEELMDQVMDHAAQSGLEVEYEQLQAV